MKKICCMALTLVLTAALFTGCGCTNRNKGRATTPTELPTTMPTMPTTEATTVPTTHATTPTHEETTATGNGVLEDETTTATEYTQSGVDGRARSGMNGTGR